MSGVGPLVEEGVTQRFMFSKPQLKTLQDVGKRWLGMLYFEQYGRPKNPIPLMPMYRDPDSKTELEAGADLLYEVLPMLRTLTTPGCKVALLFPEEEVIDHILKNDDIRNRLIQTMAGIEYEFGTYDWSEIEGKII